MSITEGMAEGMAEGVAGGAGQDATQGSIDRPLRGLCLAGPTGAGKSALAMAFTRAMARECGETAVEIISVDSALVYRGMDIGTAKPSAAERAEVPHHLIDVIDPRESFSAAAFAAQAARIAAEIRARGRLPLLVGGTMLYFKALREGLDPMPAADAAVRAAIEAEAAERGWPALHAELARVDPASAARLAPLDAQRIQRALEVWRISGRPLSAWQQQRGVGTPAASASSPAPWPLLSLEPRSRAWLHERIAQRFAAMLAQGLLDEVRALRAHGDLHASMPSMRCVGYRQAWAALDALEAGGGDRVDIGSLLAQGVAATRQLAKRQMTWLRSMPDRQVVARGEEADEGTDEAAAATPGHALAQGVRALQAAAQRGGWRWHAPSPCPAQ